MRDIIRIDRKNKNRKIKNFNHNEMITKPQKNNSSIKYFNKSDGNTK